MLLWNIDTKRVVASLTGHRGAVFACAFSPVGEFLASAGEDRTLRLWNVRGGKNLSRFKGAFATCGVYAERYEFSTDGESIVAIAADDQPLCKWQVKSGRSSFVRPDVETLRSQQQVNFQISNKMNSIKYSLSKFVEPVFLSAFVFFVT